MSKSKKKLIHLAVLSAVSLGLATGVKAANITWIGGNATWSDGGSILLWSPFDEPDGDDVAIFNTNNTVALATNNSTAGLTLLNGIDLDLAGFDLSVNGAVAINSTSGTSTLTVPTGSLLSADDIVMNPASLITLSGGTISIIEEAGDGQFTINDGRVSGFGTISLGDAPAAAGTVLFLLSGGTLTATSGTSIADPFGSASATLTISVPNSNGRVDLDNVGAVINISRNDHLVVNGNAHDSSDPYTGLLNMGEGSTLTMSDAWQFNGTLNANTSGILLGSVGAAAHIAGGAMTQTGGAINLNEADTLAFDATFTMTGGALTNAGHVIFNANATIGASANFTNTSSVSSITLASGVQVTVNQGSFNVDGLGFEGTNVLTINSGAQLTLNLTSGDDFLDSRVVLQGGTLHVNTTDNTWAMGGVISVPANTGTSVISGDTLSLTGLLGDFPSFSVGANSTLRVDAVSSFGASSTITVAAGGVMDFNGDVTLTGGSISGAGLLKLEQSVIAGNTTINTAEFDWDGDTITELHTINAGVTFTINSNTIDAMDDRVTIHGSGGSLIVNGPATWTLAANLSTNPLAVGTATIGGTSRMQFVTSLWTVGGNTTMSAPLTLLGSTITIAGAATLSLSGDTVYQGNLVTGTGTFNPSSIKNTVAADTTINVTNLNFDRGDWEVQSLRELTINVTDYDSDVTTDAFDNVITLNSGRVIFNSGDAFFVMNGTLNMNNTTDNLSVWQGEPIHIGDDVGGNSAHLNIGGTGTSQIFTHVTFNSDANLVVGPNADLHLDLGATFNSVNGTDNTQVALYAGTGEIAFADTTTFNEATLLNFTGGTVDLDGTFSAGFDVRVFAPTVINAQTMRSFGKVTVSGFNRIVVDNLNGSRTGALTVNLDSAVGEWTINPEGRLALLNGTSPVTLLAGSDLNMNGLLDVVGDVRSTARLDIAGNVNINTAAEPFRLGGGNNTTDPNRLIGGNISGVGLLGADSARALHGFGTIDTDIDFDGTAELMADNGTLVVNGAIVDAGNVGATSDGILNVVNPWNSSPVTNIVLEGGTLTGGLITLDNANGINGIGRVSARVINNTRLNANTAGTLIVQTALNDNDWDGATENGLLVAGGGGTLEIRDTSTFLFNGGVTVLAGSTVFINGFSMQFETLSDINLTNGLLRADSTTDFFGSITVHAGADSEINVDFNRFMDFNAASTTTLNGNLRLTNNNIIFRNGATFSGGGALIITNGSFAGGEPGATVNVLVENRGTLMPGNFAVGTLNVKDFQQTASGKLALELGGTLLNQYDRLVATGVSSLNGGVELSYAGGFAPQLNDAFVIVSSSGGVIGTFASITPPPPLGLLNFVYTPTYNPTNVILTVTKAYYEVQAGLYPQNFTGNSYEIWKTTNGTATLTGNSTITGPTNVFAGKLIVGNPGALGLGGLDIKAGGRVQLDPALPEAVKLPSLTIAGAINAWTGQLDLTSAAFILQTPGGAPKTAAILTLLNQINQGRNGGLWNGQGITSSTIPTTPDTNLALLDNADLGLANYRGKSVNNNSLILVQAHIGDANADGKVNAFDLNLLAAHWQQVGGALWSAGDFNGDGSVNAFDLNLLAAQWQFGGALLPAGLFDGGGGAGGEGGGGGTSVPEPATALGVLAALPLMMRRRKRV